MRKLIEKFVLSITVIASIGLIITGVSIASFRSSEMIEGKSYSSFVFSSSSEKLTIGSENKTVEMDKSFFEKLGKYKDILYFTPLGAAYGLIEILIDR